MEKFIPYAKLSKKKKRELDAKRRGVWTISPVTRKPAAPKAYNRSKARKWRDDDSFSVPFSCHGVYLVSSTTPTHMSATPSTFFLVILSPKNQSDMGISTSDHQIIFDDAGLYSNYNMFLGGTNYVVFKFRVNNTSSGVLDYSSVGYNMSAYCNGYLLDDTPEILINENIDGYSNIFDVDSIAPGMSANIYVAFECAGDECAGDNGTYSLVYDEGYIVHEQLGVVTVDLQYDIGTEGEIAEQGRTTLADIAGDTSYDPFTGTTD